MGLALLGVTMLQGYGRTSIPSVSFADSSPYSYGEPSAVAIEILVTSPNFLREYK